MIHPTTTPIEVEKDGVVRSFPYHDGRLDGVLLLANGDLVLAIRSIDSERRLVTLHDIVRVNLDEFWDGNLIVEIYVMTHEMFRKNGEPFTTTVRDKLHLDPEKLPDGTYVFAVVCAYGAYLVAVCRDIRVTGGYLAPVEADVSPP